MDSFDSFELPADFVSHIKVLFSWAQCLGPFIFTFNVNWPPAFSKQLTAIYGYVNIDFMRVFKQLKGITCALDTSFFASFRWHMAVLPILLACVLMAVTIAYVFFLVRTGGAKILGFCSKRFSTKVEPKFKPVTIGYRAVQTANLMVFLMYPSMCSKIFRIFKCDTFEGEGGATKRFLRADLDIDCSSPEYDQYAAYGAICIVVYVIGIPLVTFLQLWRSRKLIVNGHDEIAWKKEHARQIVLGGIAAEAAQGRTFETNHILYMKLGQLYRSFESEYWYFELIDMARKMILTGGLVLLDDGPIQILLGIIVCLLYQGVFLHTLPMLSNTNDVLQEVASWHLLLTLVLALYIQASTALVGSTDQRPHSSYNENATGILLQFMFVVTFLFGISILLLALGFGERVMRTKWWKKRFPEREDVAITMARRQLEEAENKKRAKNKRQVAPEEWNADGPVTPGKPPNPPPRPRDFNKNALAMAPAQQQCSNF